jgi:hypothetical protein
MRIGEEVRISTSILTTGPVKRPDLFTSDNTRKINNYIPITGKICSIIRSEEDDYVYLQVSIGVTKMYIELDQVSALFKEIPDEFDMSDFV